MSTEITRKVYCSLTCWHMRTVVGEVGVECLVCCVGSRKNSIMSIFLSSGYKMPIIGLGTWQASPDVVEAAVLAALEAGYRHIDTAFNYSNEAAIGEALKKWLAAGNHSRDELFIVTKLPHLANRAGDVAKYLSTSLRRLQLERVDLYLIHMPFGFLPDPSGEAPLTQPDGSFVIDMDTDIVAIWKAMEEQVDAGKVCSIGVSNFNISQLERILAVAHIPPAANQVELHAYLQQPELRQFCAEHNISITAYSPLGSPGAKEHFRKKYSYSLETFPDILGHPTVLQIAEKYQKTSAQVLLRHLIQHGIAVIPKSSNPTRVHANIEVFDFELSDSDVAELNKLDQGEDGRIMDFRFFRGVEKHPEYPFPQRLKQLQ